MSKLLQAEFLQARQQLDSAIKNAAPIDLEWFRSVTKLPVVLKGVMHPDDAEHAVQAGADAIIVSNHGGRALDGVAATIDALPRVAERVNRRIPVLMDGGIRRGGDVLKSLARGATAVMIGRPYLYGLAVNGSEGVQHVVQIDPGESLPRRHRSCRNRFGPARKLISGRCERDILVRVLEGWEATERRHRRSIDHSITGGLRLAEDCVVSITDSMVDATSRCGIAIAGADGHRAGGTLRIDRDLRFVPAAVSRDRRAARDPVHAQQTRSITALIR